MSQHDKAEPVQMMRTTVLIPAHNEVLTVRKIVDAAISFVDSVIVIDDGSTDGTSECLETSGAMVVRHADNRGKGPRLVEGLALAYAEGADIVLTLDADQQHDPADIPRFLKKYQEHPNSIVLGDRSAAMEDMPKSRRRGIKFGNFFIGWACGRRIQDAQCGMRLYPAFMWDKINIPAKKTEGFQFETAVLMYAAEAGVPFEYVPIEARYEGFVLRPSHFDPIPDFLRLFGLVTVFLVSRRFHLRGLLLSLCTPR